MATRKAAVAGTAVRTSRTPGRARTAVTPALRRRLVEDDTEVLADSHAAQDALLLDVLERLCA